MGNTMSVINKKKVEPSTDDDLSNVFNQIPVLKPILMGKWSNLPGTWNPAFNEF
jgi:hypothetical protein